MPAPLESIAPRVLPEPPSGDSRRPLTAVIADDSALFREFLRRLLGELPGVDLLAAAADGREALEMVAAVQPDLILLDLHMPGIGGLHAASIIRQFHPATRVVVVTDDDAELVKATCFAEGADRFVSKRNLCRDLHRAIAELFPESICGRGHQQQQSARASPSVGGATAC